jgi:hypothetical protein
MNLVKVDEGTITNIYLSLCQLLESTGKKAHEHQIFTSLQNENYVKNLLYLRKKLGKIESSPVYRDLHNEEALFIWFRYFGKEEDPTIEDIIFGLGNFIPTAYLFQPQPRKLRHFNHWLSKTARISASAFNEVYSRIWFDYKNRYRYILREDWEDLILLNVSYFTTGKLGLQILDITQPKPSGIKIGDLYLVDPKTLPAVGQSHIGFTPVGSTLTPEKNKEQQQPQNSMDFDAHDWHSRVASLGMQFSYNTTESLYFVQCPPEVNTTILISSETPFLLDCENIFFINSPKLKGKNQLLCLYIPYVLPNTFDYFYRSSLTSSKYSRMHHARSTKHTMDAKLTALQWTAKNQYISIEDDDGETNDVYKTGKWSNDPEMAGKIPCSTQIQYPFRVKRILHTSDLPDPKKPQTTPISISYKLFLWDSLNRKISVLKKGTYETTESAAVLSGKQGQEWALRFGSAKSNDVVLDYLEEQHFEIVYDQLAGFVLRTSAKKIMLRIPLKTFTQMAAKEGSNPIRVSNGTILESEDGVKIRVFFQ